MNPLINERFESMVAASRLLKQQFQRDAQALLKEAASEFFKDNPGIKLITWSQYTPYFNDGDTCTFRVNDVYFSNAEGDDVNDFTGYGDYDGENNEIWSDNWNYIPTNIPGINAKDCKALSDMITSSEMESVMLEMFGDHASIKLTANGFSINEYDHD